MKIKSEPRPAPEIAISVLMPSIRSSLLRGVYNSIASSFHGSWELVVVSPYPLPDDLKGLRNVVHVQDHGSPIRARQIGLEHARGEYICYAADDVLFFKNALDLAYAKVDLDDYKQIVLGKYCEGDEINPYMRSDIYYILSHHAPLVGPMSRIPGGDRYWLLNTGLISTKLMKEIGGFDCRFEACAMACVDLSIRLQNYGAQIIVQQEPFFHSTHLPGIMGDHEPIHVAQTTHDMPLFAEMYKKDGADRKVINLDNWIDSPDWWTRRFGVRTRKKALFITGDGEDIEQFGISAWNAFGDSRRVTFSILGERRDASLLRAAKEYRPDVIFYIGGNGGPGLPSIDTMREFRKFAKSIHLCFDAADRVWHPTLLEYKAKECFDLQVATDGAVNAPVDMSVVALCDPRYFDTLPVPTRDIHCGFPGQIAPKTIRDEVLPGLIKKGLVTLRPRTLSAYTEYPPFLRRCEMIINFGMTGNGVDMHVKARAVEAGLAGACVLEMAGSPLDKWFPRESFICFSSPEEAEAVIKRTTPQEAAHKAAIFSKVVRTEHSPQKRFKEMLARVGL